MDSPYFDSSYFDPNYFDTDSAPPSDGGHPGRPKRVRRRQLAQRPEPVTDNEDWVVLIT